MNNSGDIEGVLPTPQTPNHVMGSREQKFCVLAESICLENNQGGKWRFLLSSPKAALQVTWRLRPQTVRQGYRGDLLQMQVPGPTLGPLDGLRWRVPIATLFVSSADGVPDSKSQGSCVGRGL